MCSTHECRIEMQPFNQPFYCLLGIRVPSGHIGNERHVDHGSDIVAPPGGDPPVLRDVLLLRPEGLPRRFGPRLLLPSQPGRSRRLATAVSSLGHSDASNAVSARWHCDHLQDTGVPSRSLRKRLHARDR